MIDTANYDMNDLPYGMYTIGFNARQTLANSPFEGSVFSVLHFTMSGDYMIKNSSIQIAYRDDGVKVRVRWTDNWTAWKYLITSWT
jgi:hypothetical protein